MAFIDTYFKEVEQRFAVMKQEREPLEQAARLLFEAEKEHHTIYTFGSGHSHMIGQDIYARAGGYAKVYPINEIEMTLATHTGADSFLCGCTGCNLHDRSGRCSACHQ